MSYIPTSRYKSKLLFFITLCLSACLVIPPALAGPREQAKRIHDRIAGTPPSATDLTAMEGFLSNADTSDDIQAANIAIENSSFYNVTLKNFVTPWTNEEQTVFASLNDYTATVIGMIRDDVPFNQLLSADILYIGDSGLGLPAYSTSNNDHYVSMEEQDVDLKTGLVQTAQSTVTSLPTDATSGVITTRAAAKAFFIDGTNRAMFRFTLMNHLCTDLEQIKDNSRPTDRVRQDVSRSPGGDSRIFLNACVGCHAGMDPLVQAYAYYNYEYDAETDPDAENGQLSYNDTNDTDPETGMRVKAKYHINANNFEYGYRTPDDSWTNYWRYGSNANLGWSASGTGNGTGAKSMGEELANSLAFAQCQVEKVFKTVCLREPTSTNDNNEVERITNVFMANSYSMKRVFAETALYCKGD